MELAKFMFKLNFNSFFESVSAIHKYNTTIDQSNNKFLLKERTIFG